MPMHHLQHNRAHTSSAACTSTKITKIKKLIHYTYLYVLLFFQMSRPIAVSNLGPGIFTYKQTYFVCFFVFLRIHVSSFSFTNLLHILMEMLFWLYNLQDPPEIFLRLKVNVFQRYLALPYTFSVKERFKYLVEFLGLLGSQ